MSMTEDPDSFQLKLKESSIKFEEFTDFSIKMLDILLAKWRNYEHPSSYIIPPNFPGAESLKRKSDDLAHMHQLDTGEILMFEAIQAVISENFKSPFLAFYNLNMNNAKNHLGPIFPELEWDEKRRIFRDYDFILIGPEIGVIIIEVKRSLFKQKRHFQPGTRFIPDEYRTGITELESSLGLLEFLQECTGIPWQGSVCKVLFTPNLEKARFEAWIDSLDTETKDIVMIILGNVIRWFKDDMIESDEKIEKPSLYKKIRQLLEDTHGHGSISKTTFESYGAVLTGFASVTVKKSGMDKKIHLDEKKLLSADEIFQSSAMPFEGLTIGHDDTSLQKQFKTDPKKGPPKLTDEDLESNNHTEQATSQEGNHCDSMAMKRKFILERYRSETMPKASTNRKGSPGVLEFVGPAQMRFSSFLELSRYSLDNYCPNWNSRSHPASYILPPTFHFINPEKSDSDIEHLKKEFEHSKERGNFSQNLSFERPVIDRQSDNGEFVIFQAIWKLVQEKLDTPFLAFHRLNLRNFEKHLQEIFPNTHHIIRDELKMMHEYDFILIGPGIGMIIIEVKSSYFTKSKDFAPRNKIIPDGITIGIDQVNSFKLEFFRDCAGIDQTPMVPMRKILFTPNLEKNRQRDWYKNLDPMARDKVDKCYNGIIHWFKDDMENVAPDSLKPALYSSLRRMIEADGFQIPMEIYELCGPILVGFGSARIFQSAHIMEPILERLSISDAILRDAAALESQDPRRILDNPLSERKRSKIDVRENTVLSLSSKMIMLTPDQQKALNGRNRQFIIGPAGTGKTIILQAKILELLRQEKSILVFSTSNFCQHYRILFDCHGTSRWLVRSLMGAEGNHVSTNMGESISLIDFKQSVPGILNQILALSKTEKLQEMLNNVITIEKFDAIFIDDAFDDAVLLKSEEDKSRLLGFLLATMALGKAERFRSKIIWIVLDPYLPPKSAIINFYGRMLELIMQEDYFSRSCLKQVMRSSESVFHATYGDEIFDQMSLKPMIGHKIHGFSDIVRLRLFENDQLLKDQADQIQEILWKETHRILERLHKEGFDYCHLAVIIGSMGSDSRTDEATFCKYVSDKCRQCGIPNVDSRDMLHENGKLVIDVWHNVSSLEWPVVIFTAAENETNEKSDRFQGAYQLYRACSRATMKLFQIIVQYK